MPATHACRSTFGDLHETSCLAADRRRRRAGVLPDYAAGTRGRADPDRPDRTVLRPVRRVRQADGRRHQGLPEAARHHGRRAPRGDPHEGHHRPRARNRQAPGAGAGGARQGRFPGRLLPDARSAGRDADRAAGEGADGGLQCRVVVDHHQVGLRDARVDDAAAGVRANGHLGAEERHQAGRHRGGRLRAGHRCRACLQADLHRRAAARWWKPCACRCATPSSRPSSSA
ncbi:hypothetical protein ACEQUB_02329 [Ralstonia syzygii]